MSEETKTLFAPANYQEMSQPFPDLDAANVAINGFWDDFYALRNKYRLADVHVVIRVPVACTEGDHAPHAMITMHAGDSMHAESMCAYAFGQASAERQAAILSVIANAGSKIKLDRKRK